MITTKQLQYSDLIQTVSEEDIAMFYLGVNSKSKMFSYFREETNPGYYFYYNNAGTMQYFDCVESRSLPYLIMELNNWTYKDLIDNIKKDFAYKGSNSSVKKKVVKKISKKTILDVKYRDWEDWDISYWKQGGITKEWLEFAKIFPISYYFLHNRTNIAHKWSYTYDCYWEGITFRRKIYQPLIEDKSKKWISNISKNVVTGWDTIPKQGGDTIITASSYKDSGVIQCNLVEPNSRRMLPSFAPNTESAWLPEIIVPKIKSRFKVWLVLFDNDHAGRVNAKRYEQKYGCKPIFIPHNYAKDPFEYRSKFGEKEFVKMSNYIIYGT